MIRTPTLRRSRTAGRQPVTRVLAVLAALVLTLTACASDQDQPAEGPGETQVVAGGDIAQGELANLPVPDAADEAGGLNEEQGVQTQNFIVTATTPVQVQSFYRDALPELGWEPMDTDDFNEGLRSTWTKDGFTLLVATAPQGDSDDTSLSLQLSDDAQAFPEDS